MSLPSFKQMQKDGAVKRADARKMRIKDLHVEPGFNLRIPVEQLTGDARAEAEAADESLYQHIANGGYFPPLEVRPRAEGGAWIVEGHRRRKQIQRALENGVALQLDEQGDYWVDVVPFEGNDADRNYRIINSQNNRKLLPLELATGYKRARGFGHSVERMAQETGQTTEFVKRMLVLIDANSDVQAMLNEGSVSPTEAAKVVRKHGENAGNVLADELKKAQAQGKTKVTARTMKPRPLPYKVADSMERSVQGVHDWLQANGVVLTHKPVEEFVQVPAGVLAELIQAHAAAQDARARKSDKS